MILPYIINVALVLGACLAFYKLLLRRETFYKTNRYVLMGCLVIAFALPLFTIPENLSLRNTNRSVRTHSEELGDRNSEKTTKAGIITTEITRQLILSKINRSIATTASSQTPGTSETSRTTKWDPPGLSVNPTESSATTASSIGSGFSFSQFLNLLFLIYWFGVIIFAASFVLQLGILLYRSLRNSVIIDGRFRIVELEGDKAPCSFGNTIFINPTKYDWETYNQILLHEKIHIRERHTLDIILAEMVLIFQWFNPFAWIYRREIENNLEYLTDDQLVRHKEVDKRSYQLSLLKVTAPHMPLSLTTNYNQSTLKKRIAMMNTKRSDLHTAWKYFFLLPVLLILASLLNEPTAISQARSIVAKSNYKNTNYTNWNKNCANTDTDCTTECANEDANADCNAHGPNAIAGFTNGLNDKINVTNKNMSTDGYWFAVIKEDKVNIRFSDEKMDEDIDFDEGHLRKGHSFSGSTFKLSELGTLPRGTEGIFYITREAGKLELKGKFDGNTGMGTYHFIADKEYFSYMNKELGETLEEDDQLAFFFINIKKDLPKMLKSEGFTKIDKDELIPVAALGIDQAFIRSIRNAGFKEVELEELVPLKALGIDEKYITEMKGTLKNVSLDDLVSLKAQGIDKDEVEKFRKMKGNKDGDDDDEAGELVSFKAMGIDEAYINSFKAAGLNDIPHDQLVAFKAMGITPEYIKGWHNLGFKNIDYDEFVGMKSQDVTPEYMKSFTDLGFKDIEPENLVAFRALGVTPEYIKSFIAMGYKNIDLDDFTGLKSQGITPEFIKSFEALGFKTTDLDEFVAVKAMGVTPAYIKEMRAKGFNYNSLEKYIRLKSID